MSMQVTRTPQPVYPGNTVYAYGDTIYYGPSTVTSTSYTGTLTSGQSMDVTTPTWFVVATSRSAELEIFPTASTAGGLGVVVSTSDPSGGTVPAGCVWFKTDGSGNLTKVFAGSGSLATGSPLTITGLDQTAADSAYVARIPGVAAPEGSVKVEGASGLGAANVLRLCQVVIPKGKTLREIYAFVGTSSGNIRGSVYDIGETTSGVRTRIYDGASTASASGWVSLGDSSIAAGGSARPVQLGVMVDNTTVTIGRRTLIGLSAQRLPTGVGDINGCGWKLAATYTAGSFVNPASLLETDASEVVTNLPVLIGRLS